MCHMACALQIRTGRDEDIPLMLPKRTPFIDADALRASLQQHAAGIFGAAGMRVGTAH